MYVTIFIMHQQMWDTDENNRRIIGILWRIIGGIFKNYHVNWSVRVCDHLPVIRKRLSCKRPSTSREQETITTKCKSKAELEETRSCNIIIARDSLCDPRHPPPVILECRGVLAQLGVHAQSMTLCP